MNVYRDIADIATLEREYSPSSCVADLAALLREYAARSVRARAACPAMRSLRYGESEAESLDFFPAPGAAPSERRPLAVYIHGGYWQELAKEDHSFLATGFGQQGMHYAAIGYGLAPQASLGQMVERCRRAVEWLTLQASELGVEARALHLSGCSAGAHLAAMTALTDWPARGLAGGPPIRSLTLLSGVYDLRPIPLTYINRAVGMTADDALCLSPLLRIDTAPVRLPPMLVVVGDNETSEFKRQAHEFADAARRRGATAEHHMLSGRNHFDLVFDLPDTSSEFGALVTRHMSRIAA